MKYIDEIRINKDALSSSQLLRLEEIHTRNYKAFDGDLTGGYNHKAGRFNSSFCFKDSNKPPPYKVWAPQYNRECSELLQAKCDQLEAQGVLADPNKHGIQIQHVSPIFIQQKGRARHKLLNDCTLDEIRFISCQNVLNENIKAIPSLSTSHIKNFKFLARWKFHIFADMLNSYFQIPMQKNLWGYLAINTPYRGLRVMTRSGQGLLNSDVFLDQLLMKVLGDELAEGICEVARDDLQVGGNTVEEVIRNWDRVLSKINKCNLKISAGKVRILLNDSEVYGFRVRDGHVLPSQHSISNLGETKIEKLVTVKQVNSWKGLFKTLIAHLPNLAHFMSPFDSAAAGRDSKESFNWTPELRAAFNAAISHLSNVNRTYLPNPDDHLVLRPDTAEVPTCTGWALYASIKEGGQTKLLPVQYCSAKLPAYMSRWFPCELEGIGAVLAIDQSSHWINESKHPTTVMPDSMPVVKAANLMMTGRHSKNPRLQSLLACVNRRNVRFEHNSAKAGLHVVPDTLSRLNTTCDCKDCAIQRFLQEIPIKVELMRTTIPDNITDLLLANVEPCILAAAAGDLHHQLVDRPGAIPLGNKKAWLEIQETDADCRKVVQLKSEGSLPSKKKSNRIINRLFKECVVDDGMLVVRAFDTNTMRQVDRVVVPQRFLMSILTLIHIRLNHPTTHQLNSVFERYFFSIGSAEKSKVLKAYCDICIGLSKIPKELEMYSPELNPSHPGSHMNVDVMKRAGQKVVINVDMFSGYVTACMAESERHDDLAKAILQIVTPIRHCHTVRVRVDKAPGFQSLKNNMSEELKANGIDLDLADDLNVNSNCSVDKKIQELEEELKRISPEGDTITVGQLAMAVTILNGRVRGQGLTAAEVHFSRDTVRGENLHLDDEALIEKKIESRKENHIHSAKSKAPRGKEKKVPECSPGDIVFVTNQCSKHEARSP